MYIKAWKIYFKITLFLYISFCTIDSTLLGQKCVETQYKKYAFQILYINKFVNLNLPTKYKKSCEFIFFFWHTSDVSTNCYIINKSFFEVSALIVSSAIKISL
jgi:hypothetical protein